MRSETDALIARGNPVSIEAWQVRLTADRAIAHEHQSPEQRRITETVLERALSAGAVGVALTGSTARAKRTLISDLDYHVIGTRPFLDDLPADVDVYAVSAERMASKLRAGDDFVQWTLRLGCILFDGGAFRQAAIELIEADLWPDGQAKLARLPELRRLASRLISVGDRDAAQDHVRASLTSAARGLLLVEGVFPLARSELVGQLQDSNAAALASALEATIYGEPTLEELERFVSLLESERPQALQNMKRAS